MRGRCHLVYALAPSGTTAREANDLLNEYVSDRSRRLAVWHDHDPRYWWRKARR